MSTSTTAIIILVITISMFMCNKIPLPVTALLGTLAMYFAGCTSYASAFSGFSSSVTLMILGMSIVSAAMMSVGLSEKIGQLLIPFERLGEKAFVFAVALLSTIFGSFIIGMVVVTMFAPIIDSMASRPGSRISRKMTYLPLAIGSVVGGHATCISASCLIATSGMLAASYYGRPMTVFEPLKVSFVGIIIFLVFYATIGYKLQKKFFDFEEVPVVAADKSVKADSDVKLTWRAYFVLAVLVGCIAGFIAGLNMGATALLGASLVILTGCVSLKTAVESVNWGTIITVAAAIGFGTAVSESGAGAVIADMLLDVSGSIADSPYLICVLLLFLSTLLSNFTSNTATVTIMFPIALIMAQSLGVDAMPFALACALGADMAFATPICVVNITYSMIVGYRTKDILRIGGLVNFLLLVIYSITLYMVYFIT